MAELQYYRRGFEDCAEVVEDLLSEARDLQQAQHDVRRILAALKEKKVTEIRLELDL